MVQSFCVNESAVVKVSRELVRPASNCGLQYHCDNITTRALQHHQGQSHHYYWKCKNDAHGSA